MGRPKQLLPLGDRPVIRHCLDAILAAGIRDIVVVAGAPAADIADALRGTPATMVRNDDPNSQMADSVRTGLHALDDSFSGVLVCLSDHPLIAADTVKALISRHYEEPDRILIPSWRSKRGHPSLFPRRIIGELVSGTTLLDIVRKDGRRVEVLEMPDEGIILNINTEEDYQRVFEKFITKNRNV
jgi:molybdenum cofactor cytidylyltransferase